MTEHNIFLKGRVVPYFRVGKDLEIRIESVWVRNIKMGDGIDFLPPNSEKFHRVVKAVRIYGNLETMVEVENPNRIIPGQDKDAVLRELKTVYPDTGNRRVYVFELLPA